MTNTLNTFSVYSIIIGGIFSIVNALILIKWKFPIKTMILIASLVSLMLLVFSVFAYKHIDGMYQIIWAIEILLLISAPLLFSFYKDSRTIFSLLSVLALNLSASLIPIAITHDIKILSLRIACSTLSHLLFTFCTYKFIRKPLMQMIEVGKYGWKLASLIPITFIVCLLTLTWFPGFFPKHPLASALAIMLSCSILVIYTIMTTLFKALLAYSRLPYNAISFRMQAKTMEYQLINSLHQEKQNMILRHDFRHYISIISNHIATNKINEANEAIVALISKFDEAAVVNTSNVKYCDNPAVNAVLCVLIENAISNGIKVEYKVSLDENIHIDSIDLAVLLSNCIENAINACCLVKSQLQPIIKISITEAGKQIAIFISNSCHGIIEIDGETHFPHATQYGHGIGTISIQAFAEKYNAYTDCKSEYGMFHIRIIV